MKKFLVEAYSPGRAILPEIEAAARSGAAEVTRAGRQVRYLRSIFAPEDENVFHVFEALSAEAVREAAERAGLSPDRVVEAVELPTAESAIATAQRLSQPWQSNRRHA